MNLYKRSQVGVSLLEVLLTLVIVSIAFLGLLGLQMTSLNDTNSAYFRSQATIVINDMVARMRSNSAGVVDNRYHDIKSSTIKCGDIPVPYCGGYHDGTKYIPAVSCSSDEMAVYDVFVMSCGVAGNDIIGGVDDLLPSGSMTINCNDADLADADVCSETSTFTISVSWIEKIKGKGVKRSTTLTVLP